jgi:hypothetical protein
LTIVFVRCQPAVTWENIPLSLEFVFDLDLGKEPGRLHAAIVVTYFEF